MYYFLGLKFGKEENRSINDPLNYQAQNPEHPSSNPNRWLLDIFNSRPTSSGVRVDPETAPAFSAVYRCVSLISSTMGILPHLVYTTDGKGKQKSIDHSVYKLLREPSELYTAYTWKENMMQFALLWGNGYSEIMRDSRFNPIGFRLLHSKDVRPFIAVRNNGSEGLYYEYSWRDTQGQGHKRVIEAVNMFHIPCLSFDGIAGKSPVTVARENIGLGLAAEKFAGDFYKNNASFTGIYEHPGELNDEAYKRLKESLADNAMYGEKGKTLLLEAGTSFKPVTMPLSDAQFIESRKFQLEEIARMYGVPLHKLSSEHATSTSIEQQTLEYMADTMLPWCAKWEQEADRKLLKEAEKDNTYTKFNISELLRGDSTARANKHKSLWSIGAVSVNEIREEEDMNPIEGGDKHYIPLNMADAAKVDSNPPIHQEGVQDKKKPDAPGMGGEDFVPPNENE